MWNICNLKQNDGLNWKWQQLTASIGSAYINTQVVNPRHQARQRQPNKSLKYPCSHSYANNDNWTHGKGTCLHVLSISQRKNSDDRDKQSGEKYKNSCLPISVA